jgi:hypothetical protein
VKVETSLDLLQPVGDLSRGDSTAAPDPENPEPRAVHRRTAFDDFEAVRLQHRHKSTFDDRVRGTIGQVDRGSHLGRGDLPTIEGFTVFSH